MQSMVDKQLAKEGFLNAPIMADHVWWKSAGKIEWTTMRHQFERIIKEQREDASSPIAKLMTDFDAKAA